MLSTLSKSPSSTVPIGVNWNATDFLLRKTLRDRATYSLREVVLVPRGTILTWTIAIVITPLEQDRISLADSFHLHPANVAFDTSSIAFSP
jgi:hypothetical protein